MGAGVVTQRRTGQLPDGFTAGVRTAHTTGNRLIQDPPIALLTKGRAYGKTADKATGRSAEHDAVSERDRTLWARQHAVTKKGEDPGSQVLS